MIQCNVINAAVEPCKAYYGSPEEGDLTGDGEGDDGGSSGESLRNLFWGWDATFNVEGGVGTLLLTTGLSADPLCLVSAIWYISLR